jgi:uncharacterized membrane protein
MSNRIVKRAAMGAFVVGAALLSALIASPASAQSHAENGGSYSSPDVCYQAAQAAIDDGAVSVDCAASEGNTWVLWVVK